ncbi:MAG: hypothetical protein KGI49_00150 [Patescibacteria group bacterium]|nr:hypothetical protein [Patescibacteria group bacterium]
MMISAIYSVAQSAPQVSTKFFIVPAQISTNYTVAVQNIMEFMDKGWSVGFINTDVATNPAALNSPHVLRGCQICFGPATFSSWDGTNNPTGTFAGENGSQIGWAFDISDSAPFQVNSVRFASWSTDHANTLGYGGNLATNTADNSQLTFGTTLRGQVWSGGKLIADYHNSEPITTPVTRVFGIIRIGYYCTDSSALANDLNYFKGVMEMTNFFAIIMPNGGMTNRMSSVVYVDPPSVDLAGSVANVNIEGQRHLGLYYNLERSLNLTVKPVWTWIGTNMNEGVYQDSPVYPYAFYKASEASTPMTHVAHSTEPVVVPPQTVGANGTK